MNDHREKVLLISAALFLFLYSAILTLSPSVREHSWDVTYRLSHWVGFVVWAGVVYVSYRLISKKIPDHDPYLLPSASLLAGWGLLTIWRLDPGFGLRQMLWLIVSYAFISGLLYTSWDLNSLRRYKYILLSAGLGLTALTLLLGTNPTGFGPRLWLGCCGFYFQPSEPLKLLLVVYLAAYLADRIPIRIRIFPLLMPTIFVTGLALLLLIVQRDLGTASIFIMLFTAILYLATENRRILLVTALSLIIVGLIGFFFIDIIHARLEAWLNPWNDPSGRSYQIIQSLLAIANGGVFGRGPGLGSPSLVPVAHSDFIFTAIAEEAGLIGTFGLLVIYGIIFARGLTAALRTADKFQRLLGAGLTAYLGIQAILIIGGNLRLLPLTGVTLPFVSYGGSSLLTSFTALILLIIIGSPVDKESSQITSLKPFFNLGIILGLGLIAISIANVWWSVIRGSDLLNRTDNPRRTISDRYVLRGKLLDRNNQPIDVTQGSSGSYKRVYLYPQISPLTGYTHPVYGQAGLEGSLDDYLRGLQANPTLVIWWDQLLYGTPPPGLDVRLSLDLTLQKKADSLLGNLKGAVILMNSHSGEILVLASHPSYDPNKLDETGSSLAQDKDSPLIDRASQGMYPIGDAANPFVDAISNHGNITEEQIKNLYIKLGFFTTPKLMMPVSNALAEDNIQNLRISPLQMAVAAASLSNNGIRPAPRIALAVDTPQQGWVVLPALGQTAEIFSPDAANNTAITLSTQNHTSWEWEGVVNTNQEFNSWYLGGTLPNWQGTPLTVVILIEGNNPIMAQNIGQKIIQEAIKP
jgi:cell division protein FtsW (lipid II flippase)